MLQKQIESGNPKDFRLEGIADNESLVRFYKGFSTYEILLAVFQFLGPAVNNLHY